jgi:Ca-activated chloride channel family protein
MSLTFGHPWMLLSLLVLPLLAFAYIRLERRRVRYAVRYSNLDVLASVAGGRGNLVRFLPAALLALALAALCAALARPHHHTLVAKNQSTVVLVLDVSRSMESHDIKPTRLGAAEHAIRTFLDKAPKNLRVGLILFAGEPYVAAPPTTDHGLVRESLQQADEFPGIGGTAIGDALSAAVQLAKQAVPSIHTSTGNTIAYYPVAQTESPVSILFLSDGHQTRGYLSPLQGAGQAKAAGIPVYTVALGTPNGTLDPNQIPGYQFGPFGGGRGFNVAPDPATLKQIAQTTGGKFYNAKSAHAVESAYSSLGSQIGRTGVLHEITSRFLLLAAILLVLAGVASRFWVPRLP